MIFYWLGIFFLSSLGMFLFPVYGAVDSPIWMLILGLGIIANSTGYYSTKSGDEKGTGNRMLLFLIPVVFGIIAFRFPYSLPFYVLGCGIIMSLFFQKKLLRSFCHGTVLSGLMLGFQTACVVPYFKVAARYHEVDFFTPFFYWILKMLGITCTYSQETIFVQTARSVLQLVTMWERLGLYFFLGFFVGALVLIYNDLYGFG